MENKTKEEYKKRIIYDFIVLFVILLVISVIVMALNLISSYKEFLISENIRFMLYGFAIFFIIFILVDVFTEALNMRKAISEKNKIKNAANPQTWLLEFEGIIVPLNHKLEGLAELGKENRNTKLSNSRIRQITYTLYMFLLKLPKVLLHKLHLLKH